MSKCFCFYRKKKEYFLVKVLFMQDDLCYTKKDIKLAFYVYGCEIFRVIFCCTKEAYYGG